MLPDIWRVVPFQISSCTLLHSLLLKMHNPVISYTEILFDSCM